MKNIKRNKVEPARKISTKQSEKKIQIMLSSEKCIRYLYECHEINENTSEIIEPELRELRDEKYAEYADLLENPHLNIIPEERFIRFWTMCADEIKG